MVSILLPRIAYLATGIRKEDDDVVCSFLDNSSTSRSRQSEALERNSSFLDSALGAEDDSTPQIRFREGNAEGNVKCPSSARDDTNSQRPTQFQALSDD